MANRYPLRGGARPGSGRPPGKKNVQTLLKEKFEKNTLETVKGYKLSPLDYLLSLVNSGKTDEKLRFEAAKAAAPYVHPRLQSVHMTGDLDLKKPEEMTNEQLAAIIAAGSGAGDDASEDDTDILH